jgi:glutamine amidotransferase
MSAVAVIDYGMGNLDSVARAVDECGGRAVVIDDPAGLHDAAAVILPGVGAFPAGMENLRSRGFVERLREDVAQGGVPLLGVCLGMQLLATGGEEGGGASGLGLIEGTVRRLQPPDGLRVPHVGWNDVTVRRESELFSDVPEQSDFYFVHSYELLPSDEDDVVATTSYGTEIVAAVERDNVFGVQFHPEKSQRAGLALLRAFLKLAHANAPAVAFVPPRHS